MSDEKRIPRWAAGLALAGMGVGFAGVLILVFLAVFPQYRPGYTVFTVSMGDIFFHQAKWVTPPENPNEILAVYPIAWDENGFRVPERTADVYPILALGDSFTEAPNAARPWTDVLASELDLPVRNLAYRGFGPVEQVRILEQFGVSSGAETVVIGFFEGNDLSDAKASQDKPREMPWEVSDRALIKTDVGQVADQEHRYPMLFSINGVEHKLAFFEPYAWVLNANKRDYQRSLNMQVTMQSYQQMRALMPNTCMVVAYFPSKPHIYLPYLKPEYQPILMQKSERFNAQPDEWLQLTSVGETTFDDLLKRLPNMRDVVKEEMEAAGFVFFDLTPVLESAAAQGQMLYYTYDTHWNQAGHDLVGAAIADFLATKPCEAATTYSVP